jgi:putative flippase GtrA
MISSRPLRFLLVGALNTSLGYGVYCLSLYAGLSVPLASLVAIVFGVTISFLTQGFVVFGNATKAAFVRFVVNWAIMYGAYVGVVALLQSAGLTPYLGGLVAGVATTAVSYFILRDHVFRGRSTGQRGIR